VFCPRDSLNKSGPRSRSEDAAPAARPVSGRRGCSSGEGAVVFTPTARRAPQGRRRRSKAGRFSTRRQASEGRGRGPENDQ
jgi:hypothetical protein